jgi:hypothetical protein
MTHQGYSEAKDTMFGGVPDGGEIVGMYHSSADTSDYHRGYNVGFNEGYENAIGCNRSEALQLSVKAHDWSGGAAIDSVIATAKKFAEFLAGK